MKFIILTAIAGMALAGLPAVSMAGCAAPSVRVGTATALTALLQGNTVCVPVVTQATMDAQELHDASGALVDFKRGPSDRVEPSKQVGTWKVISGRGTFVSYDYGGGRQYSYSVWKNPGDNMYSLCSANSEIQVRIKTGGGAC